MRTVMKNKVFTRLIAVFLMALAVLTAAYPQAAYAQTDEKEAAKEELKEEIKKPEITAIEKEVRYPNKLNAKEPENLKQNATASESEKPNTNKGVASAPSKARASVVENKDNANKDYPIHHNSDKENKEADKYSADARQFITFKTKNGKTFHLIINHDEQGENVMLLTEVSEDDLLNMVEVKEKPKEAIKQETEPVKEEVKPEKKEEKSNLGTYIILLLVIGVALGAGYYFKIVKKKENKEIENLEEDDDFFSEAESEEETGEAETETGDNGDEELE